MDMFRLALLAILGATAAAKGFTPIRRLEDDGDYAWMSGYTVLYENCFHSDSLVAFRLCPENDKCEQGCSGGAQYLTDLAFFIDAYTEAQLGAHEYACEMARENCAYDDDGNEYLCYEEAGLQDCEDNEDENGFDLQEALECMEIDDGYYVGPYCSEDNYNLFLGVFTDEDCTEAADVEFFENVMGYELPYASETIVSNSCANCREQAVQQDQDDGDAEDEDDVLEQCEELYAASSKCEEGLEVFDYPDNSGCDYLDYLQETEEVSTGQPKEVSKSHHWSHSAPIWLSVLGALAVVACCAVSACYGWRKKSRNGGMRPASQPLV